MSDEKPKDWAEACARRYRDFLQEIPPDPRVHAIVGGVIEQAVREALTKASDVAITAEGEPHQVCCCCRDAVVAAIIALGAKT